MNGWNRAAATAALCVAAATVVPLRAADGFVSLFNGTNLDGWHYDKDGRIGVTVEDGCIRIDDRAPGQIMTDSIYGDFELVLECRVDWRFDTGIMFRCDWDGGGAQCVIDNVGGGIKTIGGFYEGTKYYHFAIGATETQIVPWEGKTPVGFRLDQWPEVWRPGQWNEMRLIVTGDNPQRCASWINGYAAHRADMTRYAKRPPGPVGLQSHGNGKEGIYARFRNIRIRRLDQATGVLTAAMAADRGCAAGPQCGTVVPEPGCGAWHQSMVWPNGRLVCGARLRDGRLRRAAGILPRLR